MSSRRRLVVSISLSTVATLGLFILGTSTSIAQPTNPAHQRTFDGPSRSQATAGRGATVNAIVVKSWGSCNSNSLIWDSLNLNWANYGSIPISIDYSYPGLCSTSDDVTLPELEASGADVVILSDPCGQHAQWSQTDAQALRQYALEGHDVIGSYLVFQYDVCDNRVLASLFGLSSTASYVGGDVPITPTYTERYPTLPLFRNVGNPYVSSGYNFTQTPSDSAWSANELVRARLVARTPDSMAAIFVSKGAAFFSIYVTNMPEYVGSTIDEQFYYNAIIFPATGS